MYFTVFGFNGLQQGQWMLRDLKLAQLTHLSPKATFTAQMLGTLVGAVLDYVVMQSVVSAQFDLLTSIQGSNVWSGQQVQQFSTLGIAWGMAGKMFSIGTGKYPWVTAAYLLGFLVPLPFYFAYRFTKWRVFKYLNPGKHPAQTILENPHGAVSRARLWPSESTGIY
jgi:hypothetical protein